MQSISQLHSFTHRDNLLHTFLLMLLLKNIHVMFDIFCRSFRWTQGVTSATCSDVKGMTSHHLHPSACWALIMILFCLHAQMSDHIWTSSACLFTKCMRKMISAHFCYRCVIFAPFSSSTFFQDFCEPTSALKSSHHQLLACKSCFQSIFSALIELHLTFPCGASIQRFATLNKPSTFLREPRVFSSIRSA